MNDVVAPISELITRRECVANHKIMMDKFEELKDDTNQIKVLIAELPEKVFEKADCRYASKLFERDVASTRNEIDTIKKTQELRTYDWLKYAIATAVTIAIAIYFKK